MSYKSQSSPSKNTSSTNKSALQRGILSFEILQQQSNYFNLAENFDPILHAEIFNVIPVNVTKDTLVIPTEIFAYIDFQEENH